MHNFITTQEYFLVHKELDNFQSTVRPRTERFLGQKIPRSAQNSSVGGLLLCTNGQIQTRHVQLEVYCYLLSDPFSLGFIGTY